MLKMLSKREIFIVLCAIVVTSFITIGYFKISCSNAVLSQACIRSAKNPMLPRNDVIDKMDNDSIYLLFEEYSTRKQFHCGTDSRLGPENGSGKTICIDKQVKPLTPCIVYSFGSKLDFAFETAAWETYQCEIHTFDPSISADSKKLPFYIQYHLLGLAGKDFVQEGPEVWRQHDRPLINEWRLHRLSTIYKLLHHSDKVIDILKIDVEGFEWEAMTDIISSGALTNVKQLCLEVHFGFSYKHVVNKNKITLSFTSNTWGNVPMSYQLKVFNHLYSAGFRIFRYDALDWGSRKIQGRKIHTLNELSFINLKFYE